MVINQTFEDLTLFLLIHVAIIDGELHPTEERLILEKMKRFYPHHEDRRQLLDDAILAYRSIPADLVLDEVKQAFKRFSSIKFSSKYKVYLDMYDVINADGRIDESEERALAALKEIINVSAAASKEL